jgi:hypothetical protein
MQVAKLLCTVMQTEKAIHEAGMDHAAVVVREGSQWEDEAKCLLNLL